eukprot:TRINITY_DN42341_c0_g1_i1.p3 TRINITY_DN42341_c0_g1~~TRINITY_DN42341_c0_g1_i1.p3  ORF type:complete len:106 (-),score=28.20 TRINITY_DN42341_c0_g1_i1:35-352(-)
MCIRDSLRDSSPSIAVLSTLAPIVLGFALAVSADLNVAPIGVAAGFGSVCCVVMVNLLGKRLMSAAAGDIQSSEVQCWVCQVGLALLMPLWVSEAGPGRLRACFS